MIQKRLFNFSKLHKNNHFLIQKPIPFSMEIKVMKSLNFQTIILATKNQYKLYKNNKNAQKKSNKYLKTEKQHNNNFQYFFDFLII